MFEDLLNKERRQLWLSRKIERAAEALAHRQATTSGAPMANVADRITISTMEDISAFQPVLEALTIARAASGIWALVTGGIRLEHRAPLASWARLKYFDGARAQRTGRPGPANGHDPQIAIRVCPNAERCAGVTTMVVVNDGHGSHNPCEARHDQPHCCARKDRLS